MGISAIYGIGIYNQSKYDQVYMPANTSFEFSSVSHLRRGTSGSSQIVFQSSSSIRKSIAAKASILFSLQGAIKSSTSLSGSGEITFQSSSLMNVKRIKSFTEVNFITKSHLIFYNKNPYYPNWGGPYENISEQNNPSIGYMGLLYRETANRNDPPYIETVE